MLFSSSQETSKMAQNQLDEKWFGVWEAQGYHDWNGTIIITEQSEDGKYVAYEKHKKSKNSYILKPHPSDPLQATLAQSAKKYNGRLIKPKLNKVQKKFRTNPKLFIG